MEVTMSERLKKFVTHTELSGSEFAISIGSTKQEISNWMNGSKMSLRRIGDMLKVYPQLNGHWFLTGVGAMLVDGVAEPEIETIDKVKKDNLKLKEEIGDLKERIIKLQEEKIQRLEG